MMTTYLDPADELSSYTVTLTNWTDASGESVTPDSLTWTLTTGNGAVVNSRSDVSVSPAGTVTILLSGNDLAYQSGENSTRLAQRILTIEGTYDSSLGNDVPLKEEYYFRLKPLKNVS